MEKQEIIDKITKIKQKNKKYSVKILKKKFLKQYYEPIDYVDAYFKRYDSSKEIKKKFYKQVLAHTKAITKDIEKFLIYFSLFVKHNTYSKRYRKIIKKIFKIKIPSIPSNAEEKVNQILEDCHSDLLCAIKSNKNSLVKTFLFKRKTTVDMIKKYKLGTNEFLTEKNLKLLHSNVFFNIKKNIPFFKNYQAVTFKGITGYGGFRMVVPKVVQVFKYFFLRPREDLFGTIEGGNCICLCEGIFDAIALNTIGFRNCVGFGSCSPSYLQLKKVEKIIKKNKIQKIYLSFDNDSGGIIASKDLMRRFPKYKFYYIKLENFLSDPYEYFIEKRKKNYELIKISSEKQLDKYFVDVIDFIKKYSF